MTHPFVLYLILWSNANEYNPSPFTSLAFVVLANLSLSKKKDVAVVLVCAALGDTLKRFAKLHGYDFSGINMSGVVNYLESKGLMSGVQKSLF